MATPRLFRTRLGVLSVDECGRISLVKADADPSVAAIDRAARAAETAPTDAQKEAGNYTKSHITLHGLNVTIENPKSSTRSGVDRNGKRWSVTMRHHYGYIKRTEGADGDHVDVFIGPHPESELVFVIDQIRPDSGRFDEHKVVLGARSRAEAEQIYLANYQPGWRGLGAISEMDLEPFKDWLANGDTTEPIRNRESLRRWQRDLRTALGQPTAKASPKMVPRPGLFRRLAEALVKARRRVQRPGSRGGRGYYDDRGEWVYGERPNEPSARGTPGAVEFFSPNVDENLSRRQASARLRGRRQQEIADYSRQVDQALGTAGEHLNALGDWSTGRENSLVVDLPAQGPIDRAALEAATALKCLRANQIAGAIWRTDPSGPGRLYVFTVPASRLGTVRQRLDAAGIVNRTFIPQPDGDIEIRVAHPSGVKDQTMLDVASEVGVNVECQQGEFWLIGDPAAASRDVAAERYDHIVRRYLNALQGQVRAAQEEGRRGAVRRLQQVISSVHALWDQARRRRLEKSALARSDVSQIHGRFQFIGDPEGGSRDKAEREYDRLIAQHTPEVQGEVHRHRESGLRRHRDVQGTSKEAVTAARATRPLKKSRLAFLHLPCRIDGRGYISLAKANPADHHARLRYLFGERERVNRELWYLDDATARANPMLAARRTELQRELDELNVRIDDLRHPD